LSITVATNPPILHGSVSFRLRSNVNHGHSLYAGRMFCPFLERHTNSPHHKVDHLGSPIHNPQRHPTSCIPAPELRSAGMRSRASPLRSLIKNANLVLWHSKILQIANNPRNIRQMFSHGRSHLLSKAPKVFYLDHSNSSQIGARDGINNSEEKLTWFQTYQKAYPNFFSGDELVSM